MRTACLAFVVAACASNGPPANTPRLSVDFSFANTRPCSNESPPIDVYNAPAGTTRLRIQYVHVDALFKNSGTSEVEYRGAQIPAGALSDYRGPCPVGGALVQTISYDIRVSALNAKGEVVAYGSAVRSYTPPKLIRPGRI